MREGFHNTRSCAVTAAGSRGRKFQEKPHPYRSPFERDRDRIIHSTAFRRLEGKTQVFTPGVNDYYRTRLTHSIEVSQIGRTIARALGLNESLTEAICLGHDLGHAPFGHSGEKALAALMADFGGFEHNLQSLRIVDLLEHPYPDFMGLNLMYETRLGLARHSSPYDDPGADMFDEANCSLEGQVANIADRIAYNCHDLEDGLKAGLLNRASMREVVVFAAAEERVGADRIDDWTIRRTRTAKAVMDVLVSDCIAASIETIGRAKVDDVGDVCGLERNLIVFSAKCDAELADLEKKLLADFYHSEALQEAAAGAAAWLAGLFERLCDEPEQMPGYFRRFISEHGLQRAVCDYVAGMTDGYCLKKCRQLGIAVD